MRVLLTALPAIGHVNAILPLALALQAAGHAVAVATGPSYRSYLEAADLEFLAAGVETFDELFVGGPPFDDPDRPAWTQRVAFGTRGPERMIPDLLRHVEVFRPDVLVRESTELGAALVGEHHGIPHAGVASGSLGARDDRRLALGRYMEPHRSALGLSADPDGDMLYRYLHFSFVPPTWDGERPTPPTLQCIRYDLPDRPDGALAGWTPPSGARPFVFASLGTVMHASPGLMEAVVEALGGLDVDVMAAVGRDQLDRFPSPPPNVRLEPFVPQIELLRHATLFVTHGGFNGTKEALRLGVPLVVLPISGDQPYTAERVGALGLGVSVGPEDRSAARIRAAVAEVLSTQRYRAAAGAFSRSMAALPPIDHAIDLLGRLARERLPMPRA